MNVGVLSFRFIDDNMPLQKTTRRESLDFIQEHINVADKVNVVSIRNVVWNIDVLSRALWQVVSQIAKLWRSIVFNHGSIPKFGVNVWPIVCCIVHVWQNCI